MTEVPLLDTVLRFEKVGRGSFLASGLQLGVASFQWTVERLGRKRLSTGCVAERLTRKASRTRLSFRCTNTAKKPVRANLLRCIKSL